MSSLDVDSLFTNIPFEETTEICTNELFKESETVDLETVIGKCLNKLKLDIRIAHHRI